MKIQTVLALTDLGDGSVAGLKAGLAIAKGRGGRLVVGHVLVPRTLGRPDVPAFLGKHGIDPASVTVDIEVDADVMSGIDLLVDEQQPDLVVLSAPRRKGLSRLLFASLPVGLIGKVTAPVLVVPPNRKRIHHRTALVCVDGAPQSQLLLDAAATLLGGHGRIVTLFVVEDSPLVVAGIDIGRFSPAQLKRATAAAAAFQERLSVGRSGISLAHEQRVGDAVKEICRAEADHKPDFVVVGTGGVGGTARFILGSVAAGVLRQTKGAVLAVPTMTVHAL
jgi:nucleotide-binding universal stress UspA family protein